MKTLTMAVLVCLSLTVAFADEFGVARPLPRVVTIGGESFGAAVLGCGAGVASSFGIFRWLESHDTGSDDFGVAFDAIGAIFIGCGVIMPVGSALGAWGAGSLMHEHRPFLPAILGSGLGTVVGLGFAAATYSVGRAGLVIAVCMPPAGAVIGYNLGRPRDAEYGWLEQRLDVPRMAMTVSRDELNRPAAGVKCDLLFARF